MSAIVHNRSRNIRTAAPVDLAHFVPAPLDIMGVSMIPFTSYAQACETVAKSVETRSQLFCVAINPEKVQLARRDAELKSMLNSANMQICDGIGTSMAASVLYGRKLPRITGVDLCGHLMSAAELRGWRVYLLGASPEVCELACCALKEKHPNLSIAGHCHGYFSDSAEVINDINASGADLLFVALGSPRQEEWISTHRKAIHVPFCMGVGGTLDIVSGKVRRAPRIVRKLGVEWLYRLLVQPSRWRRQCALPRFVFSILRKRSAEFRPRKPR